MAGIIEHFTTDVPADSAINGIKKLLEDLKTARNLTGDMTVICPQAKFTFECVVTEECVKGSWVVTNRSLNMQMLPDKLPPKVWPPSEQGGPKPVNGAGQIRDALGQFQTWVGQKNGPEIRRMKACEDACQKATP